MQPMQPMQPMYIIRWPGRHTLICLTVAGAFRPRIWSAQSAAAAMQLCSVQLYQCANWAHPCSPPLPIQPFSNLSTIHVRWLFRCVSLCCYRHVAVFQGCYAVARWSVRVVPLLCISLHLPSTLLHLGSWAWAAGSRAGTWGSHSPTLFLPRQAVPRCSVLCPVPRVPPCPIPE